MICNAGEAFSLRSILILGKYAGLALRLLAGSATTILGLVVFDIWQAVDILLPDGTAAASADNYLGSNPHVYWKTTTHYGCF
jgi:hypothetical protein